MIGHDSIDTRTVTWEGTGFRDWHTEAKLGHLEFGPLDQLADPGDPVPVRWVPVPLCTAAATLRLVKR